MFEETAFGESEPPEEFHSGARDHDELADNYDNYEPSDYADYADNVDEEYDNYEPSDNYDTTDSSDMVPPPPAPPLPTVEELVSGLNDAQALAVRTTQGPLLVVAGPGSGKTRVLTHRVAAIVSEGTPAWRVCAVTFTNKAAREMRERTRLLLGDEVGGEVVMSTFHALCARILRRDAVAAGLRPGFGIADTDDTKKIIRRLIGSGREATKLAGEIASAISAAKSQLQDPVKVLAGSPSPQQREFADIAHRYELELRLQNLVDFDDLICLTVALLSGDTPAAQRWRGRFTHLLVDEFQDTNGAQFALLHALTDLGRNDNVCVVGDPKQAIYGWRGASAAAIDRFRGEHPGLVEVTLTMNYRSTPDICAVATAIISPIAGADGILRTDTAPGEAVQLQVFTDSREEASGIAGQIVQAGAPWSERAVLYRTNAQSLLFEQELRSRAIPYEIIGGQRFYDRAEVRDVMAWVRLAANPTDLSALQRAASTPRSGLGDRTLEAVLEHSRANEMTLIGVLTDPDQGVLNARAEAAAVRFTAQVQRVRDAFTYGPAATMQAVLDIPGFREAACGAADRVQLEKERQENLAELIADARRFELTDPDRQGERATLDYIEQVLLRADDVSDVEAAPDRVGLMTVHGSKGREFDSVWVVGCEDGLFPHASSQSDAEVDEERRLLFVAVSRAARQLSLSRAERRQMWGSWDMRDPSPFLSELDESLVGTVYRSTSGPVSGLSRSQTSRSQTRSHAGRPQAARSQPRKPQAARSQAGRSQAGRSPAATQLPARAPAPTRSAEWQVDAPQVSAGSRVRHESFGDGDVISVDEGTAVVRFADRQRTLMLSVAPLKLL
jgi:superfamily I DNA/RNA helicase